MRRDLVITMVLLCLGMFLSGVVHNVHIHVVFAVVLTVIACIHSWFNRKLFIRYFEGLGWKWLIVVSGLLIIVFASIFSP
jgi:hypothetical protein